MTRGTWYLELDVCVIAGVMNLKVWARTLMSAIVCSILRQHDSLHTLVASAASLMMRMRLNGGAKRAVGRVLGRDTQDREHLRVFTHRSAFSVSSTLVCQSKSHAMGINIWLVTKSLPCIRFLGGAIREMSKRLLPKFVLFQLPEILKTSCQPQTQPANRNTCLRSALQGWLPLRMALMQTLLA